MKYEIYPAIFHEEEGGYWVEFPDLDGCFTHGKTLEEAFEWAGDALFAYLDGFKEEIKPTPISQVEKKFESDIVLLVKPSLYEEAIESPIPQIISKGLEKKGFTKYQVAQILDIDRSYLTHIEKGKKIPSPDIAKRLGLLLDFDWKVFYEDSRK